MHRLALVLALAVGSVSAQDQQPLTPEQDAFAREMISCGQKYVALKLLQPGSSSPMQIVTEGRAYPAAAREVAGDAFVDQETPAIRQSALDYVSNASSGGKRATSSAIAEVKRECDAKLAAHAPARR
jgi:hypothetical protein